MSGTSVSSVNLETAIGALFDVYDKNKDGKLNHIELFPLFKSTLHSLG